MEVVVAGAAVVAALVPAVMPAVVPTVVPTVVAVVAVVVLVAAVAVVAVLADVVGPRVAAVMPFASSWELKSDSNLLCARSVSIPVPQS